MSKEKQKFENKINTLLKIKENVDVIPISIQPEIGFKIPEVPQVNLVELMNKQTEMILSLIKELSNNQNEILKQILEIKQQPVQSISPPQEFRDKVINIRFDEKGNPVGAEVKLKPFDESKLNLEDLESKEHLIMQGIDFS